MNQSEVKRIRRLRSILGNAGVRISSLSCCAVIISSLASLIAAGLASMPNVAEASGVDPLPAVARALATVTSYEVTVTTPRRPGIAPTRRRTGQRPRRNVGPGAGLGFGDESITAVRKAGSLEEFYVFKGTNSAGKITITQYIVYGGTSCQRNGSSGKFTCQQASVPFLSDPTVAFEFGAGSTIFANAPQKTVAGQRCRGFSYVNKGTTVSASGTIYVSIATNLPCRQVASITRKAFTGGGTFTRTSIYTWSHFNDSHLTIPPIPR